MDIKKEVIEEAFKAAKYYIEHYNNKYAMIYEEYPDDPFHIVDVPHVSLLKITLDKTEIMSSLLGGNQIYCHLNQASSYNVYNIYFMKNSETQANACFKMCHNDQKEIFRFDMFYNPYIKESFFKGWKETNSDLSEEHPMKNAKLLTEEEFRELIAKFEKINSEKAKLISDSILKKLGI